MYTKCSADGQLLLPHRLWGTQSLLTMHPPSTPAILQVACQPLQGSCAAGARHQWASGAVPVPHPAVARIRSPVSGCAHLHVHPVETQCTGHWQSATHVTALHVVSPASHCCTAGVQCPLYLSLASSTQCHTSCTYGDGACKAAARLHLPGCLASHLHFRPCLGSCLIPPPLCPFAVPACCPCYCMLCSESCRRQYGPLHMTGAGVGTGEILEPLPASIVDTSIPWLHLLRRLRQNLQ